MDGPKWIWTKLLTHENFVNCRFVGFQLQFLWQHYLLSPSEILDKIDWCQDNSDMDDLSEMVILPFSHLDNASFMWAKLFSIDLVFLCWKDWSNQGIPKEKSNFCHFLNQIINKLQIFLHLKILHIYMVIFYYYHFFLHAPWQEIKGRGRLTGDADG